MHQVHEVVLGLGVLTAEVFHGLSPEECSMDQVLRPGVFHGPGPQEWSMDQIHRPGVVHRPGKH